MKWFKKKIAGWAREGNQLEEANMIESMSDRDMAVVKSKKHRGLNIIGTQDTARSFDASGMTFTLYKSVGGFVLETHRYDSRADRRINELYMIDEEKDFATQVAQAIMIESVKL